MSKFVVPFILFFTILGEGNAQQWGSWQTCDCWPGLKYRLKARGKMYNKYYWDIQFKNEYPKYISFWYRLIEPSERALVEKIIKQRRDKSVNSSNRISSGVLKGGSVSLFELKANSETTSGNSAASGTTPGPTSEIIIYEMKFGENPGYKYVAGCGSTVNNEDYYLKQ